MVYTNCFTLDQVMQNLTNPTICQAFWLTRNTEIAQFYLNPIMAPLVYHWQFDKQKRSIEIWTPAGITHDLSL